MAADGEPREGRRARGGVALAFALAALVACWNPLAAPFGLIVGIAAALLGARALKRATGGRRVPAAALACGVLAAIASATVLLLTAGAVGDDLPGDPLVKGRTQAELDEVLSQAGERTGEQRQRAAKELERLPGAAPATAPARDGGTGGRAAGGREGRR